MKRQQQQPSSSSSLSLSSTASFISAPTTTTTSTTITKKRKPPKNQRHHRNIRKKGNDAAAATAASGDKWTLLRMLPPPSSSSSSLSDTMIYPAPFAPASAIPFSFGASSVSSTTSTSLSAIPTSTIFASTTTAATTTANANAAAACTNNLFRLSGGAATSRASASASSLILSFILGGLFFSTTLSIIAAFVELGKSNIQYFIKMGFIILGRSWKIFVYGLKVARQTLLFESPTTTKRRKWNWNKAWKVLKEQLILTKESVGDGIEAMKLEASLYSAALGQPGLVFLNIILESLTPKLLATQAKISFQEAIQDVAKTNPNVRNIKLTKFDFGNQSTPKLLSARAYTLEDAIAFDFDLIWESNLSTQIKVTGGSKLMSKLIGINYPIEIKNPKFEGIVRLILTPLTETPPGFGAALVSFPKSPTIGLDIRLSKLELTKNTFIRKELLKEITKSIEKEFLWPRRIIIPQLNPPITTTNTILNKAQISKLSSEDPLLKLERSLFNQNEILQKTKQQILQQEQQGQGEGDGDDNNLITLKFVSDESEGESEEEKMQRQQQEDDDTSISKNDKSNNEEDEVDSAQKRNNKRNFFRRLFPT